ncbi:uncharacterized protein LOC134438677 [Engraulis encrasicolus]|uniref:uncharacterized protein LOC134438677 n=1 Tax=Engraulis encrasicolus TaxID=184585 RepID=UPI002FD10C4A
MTSHSFLLEKVGTCEAKSCHSPVDVVSTCSTSYSPSKDAHIQFNTSCSVERVALALRIFSSKNVFLQYNMDHPIHQHISASSISGLERCLHLQYNVSVQVDKLISVPAVTNVQGSVYMQYNIDGGVGRLFSTPKILNICGTVNIAYNINAPVNLLVTDLNISNVQGSVYITFNFSCHVNKHVRVVTITNVRKDISITFTDPGSMEPGCFGIPTYWCNEFKDSLLDKRVMLQRIEEAASCGSADAWLRVYVECLEMERSFLETLRVAEDIKMSMKRHHDAQRKKEPIHWHSSASSISGLERCLHLQYNVSDLQSNWIATDEIAMAACYEDMDESLKSLLKNYVTEYKLRRKGGSRGAVYPGEKEQSVTQIEEQHSKADITKGRHEEQAVKGKGLETEAQSSRGEKRTADELEVMDDHAGSIHSKRSKDFCISPQTRSCKSCAHIKETGLWKLLEPSVTKVMGILVYEHSCPPGSYECSLSGLRWACTVNVSFQYRLSDPGMFRAELMMLQYTPIGPLMDIKVLSGKMKEAYLPHFACLDCSDSSLHEVVRVLRQDGASGVSLEKTIQLTRFHAKLREPRFSLVELLVKLGVPMRSHVDALVYRKRVTPLTLFVYVVPRDAGMIQAVEEDAAKNEGIKRIQKNRPDVSIWMNSKFTLKSAIAEVNPHEITLKYARPPDFFEVFVEESTDKNINLELTSDGQNIWTTVLRKADYSEATGHAKSHQSASLVSAPVQPKRTPSRNSKRMKELASLSNTERVSKVQLQLISRGSEGLLHEMLTHLQAHQPPVVSQWETNEVLQGKRVLQDQWRTALTMLHREHHVCDATKSARCNGTSGTAIHLRLASSPPFEISLHKEGDGVFRYKEPKIVFNKPEFLKRWTFVADNGTLIINPTEKRDSGSYAVQLYDKYGGSGGPYTVELMIEDSQGELHYADISVLAIHQRQQREAEKPQHTQEPVYSMVQHRS